MAYATTADLIQAVGGPAVLVQLTDFDGDGTTDSGVVDAAIAEADALIDTYACKRDRVPYAAPSIAIRKLSARFAGRFLRRDRRMLWLGDEADDKTDREWLLLLSKGLVASGADPSPPASSLVVDKTVERDSAKKVSRRRFNGSYS